MKKQKFLDAIQNEIDSKGISFDVYAYDYNESDNIESISEKLKIMVSDISFNNYLKSMRFLLQNDKSLIDSLRLASDNGEELDFLNSDKLATLLAQSIAEEIINEKYIEYGLH